MVGTGSGIFLVCTANVCRSVYAAAILAHALADPALVRSSGVEAMDGAESCPMVRRLIAEEGLPEPVQLGTGARELRRSDLEDAALIITFTLRQRGVIARLAPTTRDRLFTLVEASSLAAAIRAKRLDPGGLAEWADLLNLNRPSLEAPTEPETSRRGGWWARPKRVARPAAPWDIQDAHSASASVHLERLATVSEHARRLGSILAGANA